MQKGGSWCASSQEGLCDTPVRMGVIYCISNKTNGKQYIGQTIHTAELRWKQHIQHARRTTGNSVLAKAILKYGPDSFSVDTMCRVDDNDLDTYEELAIDVNRTLVPYGYNLLPGAASANATRDDDTPTRRRYSQDKELPRYIRSMRDAGSDDIRGYVVQYPTGGRIYSFQNKQVPLAERLAAAQACLAALKRGETPEYHPFRQHLKDSSLPKGIVQLKQRGLRKGRRVYQVPPGYMVSVHGFPQKSFQRGWQSMPEKLELALAHLKTIREKQAEVPKQL